MSKYNHFNEFNDNLHKFIEDIYKFTKYDNAKKFLDSFENINKKRIILFFKKVTKNLEQQIKNKDMQLLTTKFIVLPSIDLVKFWPKLSSNDQKEKMWIYLHLLFLSANMIDDSDLDSNIVPKTPELEVKELKTDKPEFNPFVGVQSNNDGKSFGFDELKSGPASLDDKKPASPSLFNMASFTQGLGLDRYMEKLLDQLKNIDKADIDNAVNNLKTHLGQDTYDKTGGIITDMLTDITDGLKNSDLTNGNPFENIKGIAMDIAQKMIPKIKNSGIDKSTIESSFKNLLNKYNIPSADGSNPSGNIINNLFSMMNKMKDMSGIPNETASEASVEAVSASETNMSPCPVTESSPLEANNTELPTPDVYMNQLNDMLKATGMGGLDFSKIMSNITPPD